jgi:dipeptidase D
MKITELQPRLVWHYFDAICQVPHASYNEKPLMEYLAAEIKKLGYEPETDKVFNVFVRVPATKGKENIPITLLQGHHDMVAAKTKESTHDFAKDPIETVIKDG